MIEVFGRATSSNVQAVMWMLAELNVAHKRIDVGGAFGGNDTDEYKSMNPNGLVPVLRDGELVIWESSAILRYIAAQYGDKTFYPADPAKRAKLDMWSDWMKSTFYATLLPEIFFQLVRNDPALLDQDALTSAVSRIGQLAAMLDTALKHGPWLNGDDFTFGDITCGHLLYRYYELPIERPKLEFLDAYYERLKQRPEFEKHVMVSYEPLRWKMP